jgi:CHAT domain
VLSLIDEQGKPQDGFLRLHDIYNLNLPVDLVVLSACNTGLGKDVKGEGLVGIVRGFMYAGATRVVASLWKVDDEATAELMKRFYHQILREGQSPTAALRAAQTAMWQHKRWRSPYYWASFGLQGEWKGWSLNPRFSWCAQSSQFDQVFPPESATGRRPEFVHFAGCGSKLPRHKAQASFRTPKAGSWSAVACLACYRLDLAKLASAV